jgi:DNA-binding response OmpR family regulator
MVPARDVSLLDQAVLTHVQSDSAQSSRAPRCTLQARIDVTAAAAGRILTALREGNRTFILSSTDGTMAARVELTLLGAGATEHVVAGKRITVDWSRGVICHGQRQITLSRTEVRLLAALMTAGSTTMSRAELIEAVWPGEASGQPVRENALAVYVCSLRKRLATIGVAQSLATVRGVGYRLATT